MLGLILITCLFLEGPGRRQALGALGLGGEIGKRNDCKCQWRQARWVRSHALAAPHLLRSVQLHPGGHSLPVGDKPHEEAESGRRIPGLMESCLTALEGWDGLYGDNCPGANSCPILTWAVDSSC